MFVCLKSNITFEKTGNCDSGEEIMNYSKLETSHFNFYLTCPNIVPFYKFRYGVGEEE